MKKLLLLFSAFALLASCSNDEKTSSEQKESIFPKGVSYLYPSEQLGTNSKGTLAYNGNKIVSISNEESKISFTYTGESITKQEEFDLENGKKITDVSYTYDNSKLKTRIVREDISEKYPDGQYIEKVVYTHVSNEVVTYVNYTIDNATKVERKTSEGTLTYKDGNLIKEEQKSGSSTMALLYEYDAKKNPLKNITGFDLLLNEIDGFGVNNIVKTTKTSSEFTNSAVYLTTYIYNSNDYPAKQTSFDGGGKNIEYEIEYTY